MSSSSRRWIWTTAALAVVIAGALFWFAQLDTPKRFGIVVPGRLYRSGEISPRQLEHVAGEYHLKTVLSLLNPDVPESAAERRAAERLGLHWVNIPLPGNGASTPSQRAQIKAVLFDPQARPILVHCAAGTNRTGLAVGMYRLHEQGWTLDQVLAEMRAHGFEDLPRHENLRTALAAEERAAELSRAGTTQPAPP